jgi:hypothetical protein
MRSTPKLPFWPTRAGVVADVPDGCLSRLLDRLGDLTNARVIILGDHTLELMCALIRRGCPAALAVQSGDTIEAVSADLAILIQPPVGTSLSHLLSRAGRALAPHGRLALCTRPGVPGVLPALRAHGFRPRGVHDIGGERVILADLYAASSLHH